MDSVLRQPRRVVRNLTAQSSERSCCLGRPAERMCVKLSNLGRSPSAQMATEGGGFGETALPVTLKVSSMALRNNRRSLVV